MNFYYLFIFNIGYLIFFSKINGKKVYQFPIFQSNDCKVNKLAVIHPKYDSHLTWVLSPTCDFAVKYNWDVGTFLKLLHEETTQLENLIGYCSGNYNNNIFTNFDNGILFIIFQDKKNNKVKHNKVYYDVIVIDTIEFWNSKLPYINILNKIPDNITFINKLSFKSNVTFNSCIGDKSNVTINVVCIYESKKIHYQYFLNNTSKKTMIIKEVFNLDFFLQNNHIYSLHYYKNILYILYWSVYLDDEIIYAHETEKINCKKLNECYPGFRVPIYRNDDLYYHKISSIKNLGITLDICMRISSECKSYFLSDDKMLDPFVCTHAKSFDGFNLILSGTIPIANPYIGLFSSMSSDSCSIKKDYISKKYIL
ncbi:Hypothetical protein SRAE_1000106200 [Strongyloides ratti]|uniref:Uncharacterized protein n=1 Tax=Strongyloides ratti TaxID=34506 RepID=A0A090MVB6_STRRB|nr:Hypothetical protein SRAE_1000106200 [Strongyloides ratti]CEF62793.1 Hypothetical protein SRAE_1000106200 [Strongyloides ratti]